MQHTERANVRRWADRVGGGPDDDIYHPLNAVGLYGQNYQRERFCRMIVENSVPLDRMEILDLGSGKGGWSRFFAELKQTTQGITGLEQSQRLIAHASRLSPIEYVQGDMTHLDVFAAGRFDFVSACVSLMFLRDVEELDTVLEGVNRVLRPGGYFFVSELDEPHASERDHSGWPRLELRTRAAAAGFQHVSETGLFKVFCGRFDAYYGVTYPRMDWYRIAERFLPGRWGYYYLLMRKPISERKRLLRQ